MNNENLNCCGVYKIINTINENYYIGSSHNIKTRIRKHFELLKRNKHHSIHLQNAYNKYGENVFTVEVLETCDKKNILSVEQKHLDTIFNWKKTYNMSKRASGNNYNLSQHPHQIEIRKKLSLSIKGKHTKPFTINNIRYETLQDAAKIFNVDIKTISNRIKNWNYKNYFYINNPKIGEFNKVINALYRFKPKKEKKKYYCNCGIEINKKVSPYAEFCDNCRKIRRDCKKYVNPVIINNIEYKSLKEATKINGIKYATLLYRINANTITYKDYYYKNKPKDITKLVTTDDINKKISEKNKGNYGSNHKPFEINNMQYNSLSKASKELMVSKTTIHRRLNSNKHNNYKYI
jgi:hypothetical protein